MLLALGLGAVSGALVWGTMCVVFGGIDLIWKDLPARVGLTAGLPRAVYYFALTGIGAVIIGAMQRRYGIWPETLETVFGRVKQDKFYDKNMFPVIIVSMLVILLFGGCVGPEAGLTSVVVCLGYWISGQLKYKSEKLQELAEASFAATLGVIFAAPLYGLIYGIEPYSELTPHAPKRARTGKALRIVIYLCAIVGAVIMDRILRRAFGGGIGLPRFHMELTPRAENWAMFPVIAGVGIALGLLYFVFRRICRAAADKIKNRRTLSCIVGGVIIATAGVFLPITMFSGEEELKELIVTWDGLSVAFLALIAVVKLLVTNVSIEFGWRGGQIFPIVFSGCAAGFALALVTGAQPLFCVAACTAALCGYTMRRPLAVVMILFLCFPLRAVIPLAAAAYIGSFIPVPKGLRTEQSQEDQKNGSEQSSSDSRQKEPQRGPEQTGQEQ